MGKWQEIQTTELKKCICGGDATLYSYYIKGVANQLNYIVCCQNCGHRTRSRRKEDKAMEEWNIGEEKWS
ncbi:hypothetical protein M2140_000071 [Clostridiales Family XIII bacterium PM5-7]